MKVDSPESELLNPYIAGFCIGLLMIATYVLMGRGPGASGAFASFTSWLVQLVSPGHASVNSCYMNYLDPDRADHPLKDWLVLETAGIFCGAVLSSVIAGRFSPSVDKGLRISTAGRLMLAFLGGNITAFGAQFARGCTSGQALAGAPLLNLGSWAFMLSVFAGAYGLAWFVRKEWR